MALFEEGRQETYDSYWPEIEDTVFSDVAVDLPMAMMTEPVSFVDLADMHVVTAESIRHLESIMDGESLPVRRFRPSAVLELVSESDVGSATEQVEGFVENTWTDGSLTSDDGVELTMMGPAPRCVMTTLEQPGGIDRNLGVLQTLARHNRQDIGGLGKFACLGRRRKLGTPQRRSALCSEARRAQPGGVCWRSRIRTVTWIEHR